MGCGQSHIAVIYPRKGKGKASSNSGVGSDESDEEGGGTNQTENGGVGGGGITSGGSVVGIANPIPTDDQDPNDPCSEDDEAATRLRQMVHLSGSPLLAQAELSSSQSDFFKMLDEKINNGPDYDGSCEYELALDHAQLCRFLQEWQAAKTRARCQAPAKLQRYQSLQNNGDPTGNNHSHSQQTQQQLHHQSQVGGTRQQQQQYHQQQQQQQHHHKMQNQTMVYQSMNSPMSAPPPPSVASPYNNYQPQYDHYQSYRQYQLHQQQQQQYHAAAQYHAAQYQVANSVVLYDKSRGGYYTELA